MHAFKRWILATAGAAALLACGDSMMGGPSEMRNHLQDARVENQAHLEGARAATSMADMGAEMNRHGFRMDATMDAMERAMGDMMGCVDMQAMMGMQGDMSDEMDAHGMTMAGAPDFATARGEVERHAAAMASMMDQMDTALRAMDCSSMH